MAIVLGLIGLALIDSTSFGTMVLPLLLVLRRGAVEWKPLTVYFATVCGFYFAVGLALMLGFTAVQDWLSDAIDTTPAYWIQLVIGVGLFIYGVAAPDPKKADANERRIPAQLSSRAIISLALGATVLELAMMVPYLGAIAMLGTSGWPTVARVLVLAGYCLVMVLPTLVLIALVQMLGDRMKTRLERVAGWLDRQTRITALWVAAIIGLYLAANALMRLGIIGG